MVDPALLMPFGASYNNVLDDQLSLQEVGNLWLPRMLVQTPAHRAPSRHLRMINKIKNIISVAMLGLLVAGLVAPSFADDMSGSFQKADTNKDSFLLMAEAMGVYPTLTQDLFDQADANKDGRLDAAEFGSLMGLSAGLTTNDASRASSSSAQ